MVSLGTQPANRKSGFGHSSPTGARAQDLSRQQHGFRIAKNIERCLEAELYFYSRIFGFDAGDPLEEVVIENL